MFSRAIALFGPCIAFLRIRPLGAALLGIGVPLSSVACNCGGDVTVPFKRPDKSQQTQSQDAPAESPETQEPFAALQFPDAPSSVIISGRPLDRGAGHLHAALTRAREPKADALVVASGEDGQLRLEQSVQNEKGFAPLKQITRLPSPDTGCTLSHAEVNAYNETHAVIAADFSCPTPTTGTAPGEVPAPPAPDTPTESAAEQHALYIVSNGGYPRLLEHLVLRPYADQPAPVFKRVQGEDADNDGHQDVVVWIDPQLPNPISAEGIPLTFNDRTSGLQFDAKEPEHTMMEVADRALASVRGNPHAALELASAVHVLYDAFCHDGDAPRVLLGSRPGLPCPRSAALGRAVSVELLAHSREGAVAAAIRAHTQLNNNPRLELLPADRERVDAAVSRLPRSKQFEFRPGPVLSSLPVPKVHRPLLAFLDEQRLVLRGDPPMTYDLRNGAQLPTASVPRGALFTDPSDRYVATEFTTDCAGTKLRLFARSQILAGSTSGAPLAELLILPAEGGKPCSRPGQSSSLATAGIELLRWGPQGLLLSQGPSLFFLPLDSANGLKTDTGGAQPLPPGAPLPTDNQPDGFALQTPLYPWVSKDGLALVNADTGAARLIDTQGVTGRIREAALSPSGTRIAVLAGTQVWLGDDRLSP